MGSDLGVWLKIMGFAQVLIVMLLLFNLKMFFSFGLKIKGLETWSEMHEKNDERMHKELKRDMNLMEKREILKGTG